MKKMVCGAVVVMLALSGHLAQASNLKFDFSSNVNSTVTFDGAGNFGFTPDGSGNNFTVTQVTANLASLLNRPGQLTGTFAIGTITSTAIYPPYLYLDTAPVTGSGTFAIQDSATNWLTATATWHDIYTLGTAGGINAAGVVNLSGWAYSGSDADFLKIVASDDPKATISFNFVPGKRLTELKTSVASTSFSGSFNAVPVPSSLLGIASLGLVGSAMAWRRWKIAA